MTPHELQTIYLKVRKIIRSCQTMSQWDGARRYAQLFVNKVPRNRTKQIGENLTYVLAHKKQILRLKTATRRVR